VLALVAVGVLIDRPRPAGEPARRDRRAALAIRDAVDPAEILLTWAFVAPRLERAYGEVRTVTEPQPFDGPSRERFVADFLDLAARYAEIDIYGLAHTNDYVTWLAQAPRAKVDVARVMRTHQAKLATLRARGVIPARGYWAERLARPVVAMEPSLLGWTRPVVTLDTGWLVRPTAGAWVRLTGAANRRSTDYDVRETVYPDPANFVPLVIELELRDGVEDVWIEGEVATLALVPDRVKVEVTSIENAPEAGRAHLAFFDAAYFDAKRAGEVTRKYRKALDRAASEPATESSRLVEAGPSACDVDVFHRFALGDGVRERVPESYGRVESVRVRNAVACTARYDGHTVSLTWDRDALDARARAIESRWRALYGDALGDAERGALWYLTKYFTPHPPAEPHFFAKPCAFMVTPRGWSSWIEGSHGGGYDVLRGVVETDWFHAAPAVFAIWKRATPIRIPAGVTLARVTPVPRAWVEPEFDLKPFGEVFPS
jgi:hypothetical protein